MLKSFSRRNLQYTILAVFLMLNIFVWTSVMRADRHGELTVAFLDVGQGDAIYIEAPNGNQVLIDGGPSGGATLRALGKVILPWDRSLDLVLATHADQDHIGGLPAVVERMHVATVMTTDNTSDTGAYTAFKNVILEKATQHILARTGERIILDKGIVLEILFPNGSTKDWETNSSSVVARLSYGDQAFIFTGDSPQSVEQYLAKEKGGKLNSSVIKLGHHGSRTSSSKMFLSAVDPEYAVISAGKDNKYGHPHKEVTDLMSELKISAISTFEHGNIIFKTDGESLQVK